MDAMKCSFFLVRTAHCENTYGIQISKSQSAFSGQRTERLCALCCVLCAVRAHRTTYVELMREKMLCCCSQNIFQPNVFNYTKFFHSLRNIR